MFTNREVAAGEAGAVSLAKLFKFYAYKNVFNGLEGSVKIIGSETAGTIAFCDVLHNQFYGSSTM